MIAGDKSKNLYTAEFCGSALAKIAADALEKASDLALSNSERTDG